MSARILVVDDNPANLDLMLYLLNAFGHEAVGAKNGAEALDAARSGGFALILSDILMPQMDGYQLAKSVRSTVSPLPLLVAVTALAMPGDRERIYEAGFDGYIPKPLDPRAFVGQIESFLALWKP